ncbi:hypothetical protein BBJ28_00010188 [Nothophytophthora sp. Chile5]|nr:hypothetical protein BBJ28_00010188 [Nothophytophthora sp. Chile5]
MGRFLGASPMAGGDAARRGRRYEALPADNEEEEVATVPTTSTVEAAAAASSTNGRSNSRSALMRSDSDVDGSEEAQQMSETHGEAGRDEETQLPVLQRQQQEVEQEEQQQQEENKKASDSGTKMSTPEQSESDGEKEEESTQQEHEAGEDEAVEPGMIQVRILDLNGKFFTIPCRLDWTVGQMKLKVLESTEVPVASQRLIYRGRVLEDDSCLSVYKVEDGHTIHLFVRMAPTPDPEILNAELNANGSTSGGNRADDGSGMTMVTINSETVSSAVFPSDSARRVDPLMLDSPLGNCARRVKLWSSFLLIIYTMKVMGQFALLANDQQQRSQEEEAGGANGASEEDRPMERYDDNPQYYTPDPLIGGIELLVHCFGVYVGCVGFKAAHDTDIRPIRFYCRGIVWLAILTLAEQIYTTVQISETDFSTERVQYPYGAQAPTKEDIVSANIFQTILLVIMWMIAIRHSYLHQREVAIYNQSFAAAAMNAAPPVHLPEVEDATMAPSLPGNLDDDELWGGDSSAKVTKPVAADSDQQGRSNWEQIGSNEQDEFLSWLDEGPPQQPSTSATRESGASGDPTPTEPLGLSPPPAPVVSVAAFPSSVNPNSTDYEMATSNISLDDDDDDDLERIVQNASRQAHKKGNSRENSNSSLQIKSQVQAQHKEQQVGTNE